MQYHTWWQQSRVLPWSWRELNRYQPHEIPEQLAKPRGRESNLEMRMKSVEIWLKLVVTWEEKVVRLKGWVAMSVKSNTPKNQWLKTRGRSDELWLEIELIYDMTPWYWTPKTKQSKSLTLASSTQTHTHTHAHCNLTTTFCISSTTLQCTPLQ